MVLIFFVINATATDDEYLVLEDAGATFTSGAIVLESPDDFYNPPMQLERCFKRWH